MVPILLSIAICVLAAPMPDQPKRWVAGILGALCFVLALLAIR
jgi:membrane-bound ClpP family serine protease